jgi:ATPase subunit of ABC transporter with duplicated ATPase domains
MVEKPNLLVLDEPTNHLDLEAIEALVGALADYDGTLIFVSHDRWFVGQLANRILEITPGGLRDFAGTYDEYLERLGDDHLDAEAALLRAKREKKAAKEAKSGKPLDPERQRRQKKLIARRDHLTAEIDKAETRVHAINELFCDASYFGRTPRAEVSRIENEQKQLSQKIEQMMAEWEKLESEIAEG